MKKAKRLTFKDEYSEEKRKRLYERLKQKYPTRIPVILELHRNARITPLKKSRYCITFIFNMFRYMLTGEIHSMGSINHLIGNMLKGVHPNEAIFVYVNGLYFLRPGLQYRLQFISHNI